MPSTLRVAHPGFSQQQMPGRTAGALSFFSSTTSGAISWCKFNMNRLVPMAVVPVLAIVLAACGGGTAAPGAGTPFCANAAFLAALATNGYGSEIACLKAHEIRIDELRHQAPGAVRAEVIRFVTGVHRAIEASNPALANTAAMNQASSEVKAYCDIEQ
jgi:hypothetical protein